MQGHGTHDVQYEFDAGALWSSGLPEAAEVPNRADGVCVSFALQREVDVCCSGKVLDAPRHIHPPTHAPDCQYSAVGLRLQGHCHFVG